MKIRMLKGAASPEGTWHVRGAYRVPEEMPLHVAQEFVKRRAAEWVGYVEAAVEDVETENTDARPKRKPRKARK